MAIIKELIKKESNGTISFGNYELAEKKKLSDFEVAGDMYKVKTWNAMTKLERNGSFVYESIPGTAVNVFKETEQEISFFVEGKGQTQITLELNQKKEYDSSWRQKFRSIKNRCMWKTYDADLNKGSMILVKVVAK
ncbi:MAG: endosialidase [Eubacterium sp.]